MESHGVDVRLCSGCNLTEAYGAVGRSVGGKGIQHAKVVHTDIGTIIGSANWTTSTRGNSELGVLVTIPKVEREKLSLDLVARIENGARLQDAMVLKEQRSRSSSPIRRTTNLTDQELEGR